MNYVRMKKMNLSVAMLLCILLLGACSSKTKPEEGVDHKARTIRIDLSKSLETKSLQDITSSISLVRLEESDDDPIGVIDQLLITNTNIYILDRQRSKSLFIYDREGNLKNIIHKVGTGPGEFIRPDFFDIQKSTGNIIILDGNQRKLLAYSKNGDFISDVPAPTETYISGFVTANNNTLFLDKGNEISEISNKYIRVVDSQGKIITELLPVPEYAKSITIGPRQPLQKFHSDTILYMPSLSDKIYQIYGNEINLRYQLDFGKYWPNEKYFEQEQGKHPLKIAQNLVANEYAAFFNYLETKDILHVNFEYKDKPISFYYNKHSGESIFFHISDENISLPLAIAETSFVCVGYIEDKNPVLIFYDVSW
jgi:hypothetical protein